MRIIPFLKLHYNSRNYDRNKHSFTELSSYYMALQWILYRATGDHLI